MLFLYLIVLCCYVHAWVYQEFNSLGSTESLLKSFRRGLIFVKCVAAKSKGEVNSKGKRIFSELNFRYSLKGCYNNSMLEYEANHLAKEHLEAWIMLHM